MKQFPEPSDLLIAEEKYSRHWKKISLAGLILSLTLVLFWLHADSDPDKVVLAGVLRLGAFLCFALFLLSWFKVRQGQIRVELHSEGHHLRIRYRLRDRIVSEERLDLRRIKDIEISGMPDRTVADEFKRASFTLRYRLKDSPDPIWLFDVGDRILPFDRATSAEILEFLRTRLNQNK